MAQSGYTPIILFNSTTAGNTPTTGNLAVGELAINAADGKLYYNTGSAIKVLAGSGGAGVVAGSNTQVQYNNSGVFGASSSFTFDGTTLTAPSYTFNTATTGSTNKGPLNYGTLNFSDTGIVQSAQTSVNSYFQNVIQNTSNGTQASAEFIVYNDQGTATTNYATVGINSSGYSGTGSINAAGYGYFLTGSTDLVLGTIGANAIHFTTNSAAADAITISSSNVTTIVKDALVNGLTVGRGANGIASNISLGVSALSGASNAGGGNIAIGSYQAAVASAALASNTSGTWNVAVGTGALASNTTGNINVAVGVGSLTSNTTASSNTAVGYQSLYSNTTANALTAVGYNALRANTTGADNNAFGNGALYSNTTGVSNTALGGGIYGVTQGSLGNNTTGSYNTAVGVAVLASNTTASNNTAVGYQSSYSNTTGAENTSIGLASLYSNTTGSYNTALGRAALFSNTTASNNTAVGYQAGYTNTAGAYNTLIGYQAGYSMTGSGNTLNTFVGQSSGYNITSGTKNTILGTYNGNQGGLDIRTASNYIVLSDGDGNPRLLCDASGDVIIPGGGTTISQAGTFTIYGTIVNQNVLNVISTNTSASQYILNLQSNATIANTAALIRGYSNTSTNVFFVAGNGNVTNTNNSYGAISDVKLKENIVDATPKLADLMKVQIRQYNLKAEQTHKQIGVIAQEIEQVFPAMVEETPDRDEKGNDLGTTTKSVKYSVFVPMLVKAMQEQQALIESLTTRLAALEAK